MSDVITLAHGSGGRKTSELIAELFKKNLGNEFFTADDAAVMPRPEGRIAMSTDGFIVSPWEFPGGCAEKGCAGQERTAVDGGCIVDVHGRIPYLEEVLWKSTKISSRPASMRLRSR